LLLLLSWFALASDYASAAAVTSSNAKIERIAEDRFPNIALFKITPPAKGGFEFTVSPIQTLAVVDLY